MSPFGAMKQSLNTQTDTDRDGDRGGESGCAWQCNAKTSGGARTMAASIYWTSDEVGKLLTGI